MIEDVEDAEYKEVKMPVEDIQNIKESLTPKSQDKPEDPLDKIAYFVIFPQNAKVIDDAIAVIPNEVARNAVANAINSIIVPVTKEQVEAAKKEQGQDAPSE